MLTFYHVISWLLVTAIYGYSFEEDKQNDVLQNCTSQSLRNSNSTHTNYEQEEVTSYLRKHSRDSRKIKHNYFFYDSQPARPPGCPPCRKFSFLLSTARPSESEKLSSVVGLQILVREHVVTATASPRCLHTFSTLKVYLSYLIKSL